jgi:Permeases of the drug/metabolite transporter (DMT) superfamily
MNAKTKLPILFAVLAAVCYGISAPISKLLLEKIPPTQMAALLYLGAGAGMFAVNALGKQGRKEQVEAKITRHEWRYVAGMIALDIAAPILLMFGLTMTTPANASLLNNFEIAATSVIALSVFKETIGRRMWAAIALITISSMILSFENLSRFSFSLGSLLVLAACICWGIENNCTRMLSLKSPIQIVIVKGFGSGIGALAIALARREATSDALYVISALVLGFFAYGLSIFFYIKAQRELGAARTSAYYAIAPFVGTALSFVVFRQSVTVSFVIALVIMIIGAYLSTVTYTLTR